MNYRENSNSFFIGNLLREVGSVKRRGEPPRVFQKIGGASLKLDQPYYALHFKIAVLLMLGNTC
jgi:hypothetical protein